MKGFTDCINTYLAKDEAICWQGFPLANIIFNRLDAIYIPICILCLWPIIKELLNRTIDIGGVIFLLLLLYISFGRLYTKYHNKKRTVYYVTNKRVIIFNKSKGRIENAQDIQTITKISKKIGRNGVGNIEFGDLPYSQLTGGNSGMDFMAKTKANQLFGRGLFKNDYSTQWIPVFYDIANAEYVYNLVNGIKEGHVTPPFTS